MKKRKFICYWFHPKKGFYYINLGFHIDLYSPNIEIHLPFGFIRIGWYRMYIAGTDGRPYIIGITEYHNKRFC
jgi:hypothetical protein